MTPDTKNQINFLLFLLLQKPQSSLLDLCFCMGLDRKEISKLFSVLLKEGDVDLNGEGWILNRTAASIKPQPKRAISDLDWNMHYHLQKSPCSEADLCAHLDISASKTLQLLRRHQTRGLVFKKNNLYHSAVKALKLCWVTPSKNVLPLESDEQIKKRSFHRWGIFSIVCLICLCTFFLSSRPRSINKSEFIEQLYTISATNPQTMNIEEQLLKSHITHLNIAQTQQEQYCKKYWDSGKTCFFLDSEHTSTSWKQLFSTTEPAKQ